MPQKSITTVVTQFVQEPYEFIFHLLLHKEHKLPSSNASFLLRVLDLITFSLAIFRSTTKISAGDVLLSHMP